MSITCPQTSAVYVLPASNQFQGDCCIHTYPLPFPSPSINNHKICLLRSCVVNHDESYQYCLTHAQVGCVTSTDFRARIYTHSPPQKKHSHLVGFVGEPRPPAARRRGHDRVHDLEQLLHALVDPEVFPALDLQEKKRSDGGWG